MRSSALTRLLNNKTSPGQTTGRREQINRQREEVHVQPAFIEIKILVLSFIEQTQASWLVLLRQTSKHGRHTLLLIKRQ